MKLRYSLLSCWGVWVATAPFAAPVDAFPPSPSHPAAFSRVREAAVVPDTVGAVGEILLHFDAYMDEELGPVYGDLFAALPPDVRLTVVCPTEWAARTFIDRWESTLRMRSVHVINVGLSVSIWARDRYISRQTLDLTQRTEAFVPVNDRLYEEEKHADLLAQELLGQSRVMPAVLDSPLHVEGGNVVANTRHVFVGANALADNVALGMHRMADEFQRVFGRECLIVRGRDGGVPWSHVDMYLTPISDDTVLVANPRMASLILSRSEDELPDLDWPGYGETGACVSDALEQRFDDVAELLEERGYRVLRIPGLVLIPEEAMITYNNVIIDVRGECRTVYMPTYDMPDLDAAAQAVYEGLGFEVKTVDVSRVFTQGGAIRCLANVVERRPAEKLGVRPRGPGLRFSNLAESRLFESMLRRSDERLTRRSSRNPVQQAPLLPANELQPTSR